MTRTKLLIVDDDEDFLGELKESLTLEGYDVASFTDGNSALKAAPDLQPDLVVTDLKMRGKSGFQVAEELRQTETTKNIPIIAMTGFYTKTEHEKLMKICGIDVCLIKPFTADVIKRRIALILKQRKEMQPICRHR